MIHIPWVTSTSFYFLHWKKLVTIEVRVNIIILYNFRYVTIANCSPELALTAVRLLCYTCHTPAVSKEILSALTATQVNYMYNCKCIHVLYMYTQCLTPKCPPLYDEVYCTCTCISHSQLIWLWYIVKQWLILLPHCYCRTNTITPLSHSH